ncbi:hypothetical protein TanjilG_10780 [Lupinus angustifolius]|uniref:Longin domain-containing protein n=1 Tax=Lupinus angustifolius TaxID=3871 RepID=A0A1J7GA62_LUPAN|nr:hypothetical protein TanjilG_10780 [Lupinus angustifolius]
MSNPKVFFDMAMLTPLRTFVPSAPAQRKSAIARREVTSLLETGQEAAAYCVVPIESIGRNIPFAFLEHVKEEVSKKYGGGKAATAPAQSLKCNIALIIPRRLASLSK